MIPDIHQELLDSAATIRAAADALAGPLARAVELVVAALRGGGRVFTFGNGGSAVDAQHIAGELVGRFLAERKALAAEALTADIATITSVANDYSYDLIFARQLEGKASAGDVAIGLSTSGKSRNVVAALKLARDMGLKTVAFTGRDGGPCGALADVLLNVPADLTPRIQEAHVALYHVFCRHVENAFLSK
ncbi:MAG: SIS domain-containing protein [Planctomycetota bacterium]|nr:SIS domain-containing protein [Planctomycetota bacterium]